MAERDVWAEWVLSRRHGSSSEQQRRSAEFLAPIRERVLKNAEIHPGDTVLDVGAGDGLIAFGALDLVGPAGKVIFSDVSEDLLDHCRRRGSALGVSERCEFVMASAEDLAPIAREAVDAVTVRSVLIYVADKARAFEAFHRVLRPGGRLSMFEPINRYFDDDPNLFWGYNVTPVAGLAAKVTAVYRSIQPRDTDPMTNFDERDLLRLARGAGFDRYAMDLEVKVGPMAQSVGWQTFRNSAGNPRIPTIGEAIARALSPEEARVFEAHLAPLVDAGQGVDRSAWVFLRAHRSGRMD
jgi:ubiquinone/menaquinone biosynthesis C-methylase UbiE